MAPTPDPIALRGRFWQVLAPRRAHDPLSGAGAARFGGRWNPKGVPALYMSMELPTAVAEYEQDLGIRPGTFVAYDVDISGIADLRTTGIILEPWKQVLLVEHRTPGGWLLTERLIADGAAGILVPSARMPGGSNLVLWRWNDSRDRSVRALDPQTDLSRDQSSWPDR